MGNIRWIYFIIPYCFHINIIKVVFSYIFDSRKPVLNVLHIKLLLLHYSYYIIITTYSLVFIIFFNFMNSKNVSL